MDTTFTTAATTTTISYEKVVMPNKTTPRQRNLLIAQLGRLLRRVRKAINDINMKHNIADTETEMKKILSNLNATTYLLVHPVEHATSEDLINRSTDVQD